MQQLRLQLRDMHQNDELVRQKDREINHLQGQLQATRRDNEQVVTLQQSLEQKDRLLQEKERQIRELQQSLRGKEGSDAGPLKLEWRDGPRTPFGTCGYSEAVGEGMAYFSDGFSCTKVLMYNSKTEQWTVLPECPKEYFSIAVVNGLLTAIGGKHSGTSTKTLLSLSHDRSGISRQRWIEQFPPMTFYHSNPAVATTSTSLIVAGGWGPDKEKAPVEVMDTNTLHWSTVALLPRPWYQATATICGGRMYIGGGYSVSGWTKSVLMCEVSDLFQSATTQPKSPGISSHTSQVWREIAELPVIESSLVTLRGQLLAIGGCVTGPGDETAEVRQYDVTTNSWNVISQMNTQRHHFFAAVLPNDRVMVVGGFVPGLDNNKGHVEIASIV